MKNTLNTIQIMLSSPKGTVLSTIMYKIIFSWFYTIFKTTQKLYKANTIEHSAIQYDKPIVPNSWHLEMFIQSEYTHTVAVIHEHVRMSSKFSVSFLKHFSL